MEKKTVRFFHIFKKVDHKTIAEIEKAVHGGKKIIIRGYNNLHKVGVDEYNIVLDLEIEWQK